MLQYPGDWLCDNRGWIDPIGDDGHVCLARADGKSFKVQLEAVDAEETVLQCEQSADKVLVDFSSLSRYLQVAQRNSSYTVQRFMWGMHEVLAAATLFRACDTRFLGRIALVDLSWVCSQLKMDFTIEELTGVWRHLADGYEVISFAQFLEGATALRNAGGSIHIHAIRKFRRLLLTRDGLGRSVESMIASITGLSSVRMPATFDEDEANEDIGKQKKGLVYVAGVGFRPKKNTQAEKHPEDRGSSVDEPSDAAAEAAAIAAKANPNARKSYKSGNKWHESDAISPRASSPRSPKVIQPGPAEEMDPKQVLVNVYERASYTEMLVRGATSGNLDSVRLALSSGADVSYAGSRGRTPLITAAMHGHADVVAELAAAPVPLIDMVDFVNGWTALMYAGRWGLEHIVQLLLDSGADSEVVGNDGSTVRDLAYDWGYNNITGLLDKHLGLDIDLPDGGDETLRAEDRALIQSVSAGDLLGAMDALTDGADADCTDSNGNTPLIAAINAGRSDIVAILLDDASLAFEGANVDGKGAAGWTPFMYACRWGQLETMALLLANGADVSVTGEDGSTARSLLYEYGHEDLVETVILLKGGDLEVAAIQ
jgi:ankyrin repeat protein